MTKSKTRKRILIVEDDSDFREILSRTLRQAGYEVHEAEHALEQSARWCVRERT